MTEEMARFRLKVLSGDQGYAGSFRIVIPAPVAQQRVRRRGPSQVPVEFSLWGRAVRDMRMLVWVPACRAFRTIALRRGDDGGEGGAALRFFVVIGATRATHYAREE